MRINADRKSIITDPVDFAGTAVWRRGRELLIHAAILLAILALVEGILRVADFRELRNGYGAGYALVFRYDPRLV